MVEKKTACFKNLHSLRTHCCSNNVCVRHPRMVYATFISVKSEHHLSHELSRLKKKVHLLEKFIAEIFWDNNIYTK